ncbi:MAG: hypothetical protein EOP84_36325 [Verrucomicrobiaceae bacterium]|nr:MAG: hypothetical protein EOP84_36325 [Verrucomicrobiaceae bacterium]
MENVEPVDCRLRKSVMLLRGWSWMSLVSTQREEAICILAQEAKFLVQMGPKHHERAKQIGKLIVAYQRLITAMKEGRASRPLVSEGTDSPAGH